MSLTCLGVRSLGGGSSGGLAVARGLLMSVVNDQSLLHGSPSHGGTGALGRMWRAVVAADPLPNLAVLLAIFIGFFHGWLKLKFPSPLTTFSFDIPLIIALMLVLPRCGSLGQFFPATRSSGALLALYGAVVIWFLLSLVLPEGVPLPIALAAVRGWTFSTLMFGLGYQIIRSPQQLHIYFLLIIALAAVTALYGLGQSEEEARAMAALDPTYAKRLLNQAYADSEGRWVLRRFSTFISSGAFGGTMSCALLFITALLTERTITWKEKALLTAMSLLIGWGMFISGARSPVVALGVGLAIAAVYRRQLKQFALIGVVLGAGLMLGAATTGGGAVDRLATLDFEALYGRFYIVWSPGIRYLFESGFLGGGLGKSLVGTPAFLVPMLQGVEVWGIDGDLGKVMAEMGIVGVVVMTRLFVAAFRDAYGVLERNRHSLVGSMGLGAFMLFAVCVLTFPAGSPFIGIPLGVLSWFFLGAAIKLDRLAHASGHPSRSVPADDSAVSREGSAGKGRPRHFMFYDKDAGTRGPRDGRKTPRLPPPPAAAPPAPAPAPAAPKPEASAKPKKRFLYSRD